MEEKNLLKWVNGYGFQILRQVRLHGPSRKNGSCTPHQLPPVYLRNCFFLFPFFSFFVKKNLRKIIVRAFERVWLGQRKKNK
jgi:hypothetical protein